MKSCDFYCKRHILAWMHVVWAILRQNRLGCLTSKGEPEKSQKVSDSHRNDVSPLTQGLRYRAACDCHPSLSLSLSVSLHSFVCLCSLMVSDIIWVRVKWWNWYTVSVVDLWSWQEARQSGAVHNVSAYYHVVSQSPTVLFHRGIWQVCYVSTGLYVDNTQSVKHNPNPRCVCVERVVLSKWTKTANQIKSKSNQIFIWIRQKPIHTDTHPHTQNTIYNKRRNYETVILSTVYTRV